MPNPHCKGDGLQDVNPYYYKFTCFEPGTLGFLITPNEMSDDYDWELYDVTGRDPNDIYTDPSLLVTSNWSGESGLTGTNNSARQTFVCGGYGKPLFSKMPVLVKGRNYLLMVSHFTNSQSGSSLEFKGGTAVITDPTDPHLKLAEATCGGRFIRVKLNKFMKCSSIAANGSDFQVTPALGKIVRATAIGCAGGFDSDSVLLELDTEMPPGQYTVSVKKGSDGNTILDNCGKNVPESDQLVTTVYPIAPTPMDSLVPLTCGPQKLRLLFRKPLLCSSIAGDASDFFISGTYPVAITDITRCTANGLTKEIILSLDKPLEQKGSFTLHLRRGSDGNTLLDECAQETPVGSTLPFSVLDTVHAGFSYTIDYTCTENTVHFSHNGAHEVNSWSWDLDAGQKSSVPQPTGRYTDFTPKQISLAVSNGFCSDTSQTEIMFDNFLSVSFDAPAEECPNDSVFFSSTAVGKQLTYHWSFGDGATATDAETGHKYAAPVRTSPVQVKHTVTDAFGCSKSLTKPLVIYSSCTIYLPNAFTPNGDGKNDVFQILNGLRATRLQFTVFNRWGQTVFNTSNWKQGWDGRINGTLQGAGTYVWMLRFTDTKSGKLVEQKGTVVLIR
jgi:gliding motility-associated-like protein